MRGLLLCGFLAFVPLAASAEEHWRSVRGESLQRLLPGREFADGVHFAYQFNGSGTFVGTEMGKEVRGSRRVRKDEMCWKWLRPPEPERCYQVQQDGARVRLMLDGSEAWCGTLQKLP